MEPWCFICKLFGGILNFTNIYYHPPCTSTVLCYVCNERLPNSTCILDDITGHIRHIQCIKETLPCIVCERKIDKEDSVIIQNKQIHKKCTWICFMCHQYGLRNVLRVPLIRNETPYQWLKKNYKWLPKEVRATIIYVTWINNKRWKLSKYVLYMILVEIANPNAVENAKYADWKLDLESICVLDRCCKFGICRLCNTTMAFDYRDKTRCHQLKCNTYAFECRYCKLRVKYDANPYETCTEYRCIQFKNCSVCGKCIRVKDDDKSKCSLGTCNFVEQILMQHVEFVIKACDIGDEYECQDLYNLFEYGIYDLRRQGILLLENYVSQITDINLATHLLLRLDRIKSMI